MSANLLSMSTQTLAFLAGGWIRYVANDERPGWIYFRFQADDAGRWTAREMYLDAAGESLRPDMLRSVNLSYIEAWANDQRSELERTYGQPTAGDLSTLASYIGTVFSRPTDAATNWVAAAYFASLGQEDREAVGLGALKAPKRQRIKARTDSSETAFRLDKTSRGDGPLSDDFLRLVAAAYYAALARGERPNKTLAKDASYAVRTVETWVRTARDRGIMPKARKGAAG